MDEKKIHEMTIEELAARLNIPAEDPAQRLAIIKQLLFQIACG